MSLLDPVRVLLRPVNRPPAGGRRDQWVHHGARAGLVLLISLAVPALFPQTSLPEFEGILPGSVARQTVNAAFDFDVPKDPALLEREQDEAEADVTPTLRFEPVRADSTIERMNAFFAGLDARIAEAEVGTDLDGARRAIEEAVQQMGISVTPAQGVDLPLISHLRDAGSREELRSALELAFGRLREGVIRQRDLANIGSVNVVVREEGGEESVRAVADLLRYGDFSREALEEFAGGLEPEGTELFRQLILRAQPTLRVDQDATRQRREAARNAINQLEGHVLEGERIITENEIVSNENHRRLLAYETQLIERGLAVAGTGFLGGLGMVLLVASMLGILVVATYRFRGGIYEDMRSFSVLLGLIVVVMGAAGVVAATDSSPALVPVALAGLLAAALFDSLLGLVVVSTITGILLGQPHYTGLAGPMLTVAGGVTAAFAMSGIRTRSQSWILIALISVAYVGAGLLLHLTGHYSLAELARTAGWGALNAVVCTGLGMGVALPLLENFTGRTTEQSLLELSDMNRPLLRRLAREAPGTYAHSINAANLVEAACEEIGANSLLGRVGVYYHDIGKLERPQYFIENQPSGLNPHDRLSPRQSAEILRNHVRVGLQMADEARLPEVVKAFIREHHGTQTIQYFYQKAQLQANGADIDPNDFAYPGPKPQSRETGVAMLADAVEAASRLLTNPSPERIRALIAGLVEERIAHGELDECELTYRDLRIVKREFAHVLTGLYHHRIDYPTPSEPGNGAGQPVPGSLEAEDGNPVQPPVDPEQAAQGDTGPIPVLE